MSGPIFLLSWLAIPIFGLPAAVRFGPNDSRAGRFSFAFGSGAVILTLAMLLLTVVGIPWTPFRILLAASPTLLLFLFPRTASTSATHRLDPRALPGIVAACAALLLFAYAAATARATSTDYLYFWATKGQEFARAKMIDAAFLAEPDHFLLHPDYPPLLPCLYAWGATAAGRFPWGAGLLSAPIFLGLALAAFWGGARSVLGDRSAAARTALVASLFALVFVASDVAGNAEPPLLFFEALALAFLVFGDASPRDDVAASVSLAGCVLTKFEGAAFVLAAVAAFVILERRGAARLKSLLRLSAFPALALGGWLSFCARNKILYNYKPGTEGSFTLANLPKVLAGVARSASYGVGYLPWIVLLLVSVAAGRRRGALAPVVVALLVAAVNVSFYLHGAHDPTDWIAWSGKRIFLTPLLCLAFAVAARGRTLEPARSRISSGILGTSEPES